MRVVVCTILVTLILAGAGLFPVRPAAGQENRQKTLHGAAALDRLKQDGQYDSLQAAMDQARFSVNRTARTPLGRVAWHAPNPSAGYDAYVTETGVSIAVNDETYVSLSLHSLGYGDVMQAVAPGVISGDKQTIEIVRDSGLREWFVNGAGGLEHGFTLSGPPGTRYKGVPLRLTLQVSDGWGVVSSDDGTTVSLCGAGTVVEYGKLVVRDHLGRNIQARLSVNDEQVVIEVEDSEAEYPLTIDPIFTMQQKLVAADGAANDYLGRAVALSGNTALVGAPYDDANGMEQGSAYVFVRQGATWTQQARLFAQEGASFDYFGWSVALDGDTAVVGAIYGPGSVNPDQGAAYVFTRVGTTWTLQARLNAGDGQSLDQFGAAVALDGQTALIGAFNHQVSPASGKTGAAYVFVRNGVTWTQQARLEANDGAADDRFGLSVALDGDTALVGAPADNVGANADQGSAYLFTRNGAVWAPPQKLTTTDSAAGDQFGNAVALNGEKALIGAYLYGSDDRGKVFTFKRSAAGWAQTDGTESPKPAAGAHFGVSVALGGDTAVVGASLGLFEQGVDQRSAYVFVYGGEWFPVRQLGPELGVANDRFGHAVALDGDTVLVGAYRGDAGANDQGAAYVFVLHDNRHIEQQKLFANDGAANDSFGAAVALDGDTLAVGAPNDTVGSNAEQGAVYVFTRNGAVWTFQQKLTANDGAAKDFFGNAVALSGDTVVVGAKGDDNGGIANQGSAYVFTRSGTTWTQQQRLTPNDGAAEDTFGYAVALDGDTLAVGAPNDTVGSNAYQGSAYIFTRNGASWTQQQKLTANDGAESDLFGFAVALSGNTVAVGVPNDAIGANGRTGSVCVFTRSGATWTQQPKLTSNDGGAGDLFGVALALDGDTLVAGARGDTIGANDEQGSAYVFTRHGTVWTQQQKLTAGDGAARDFFGAAVAVSGDTLVVGALYDTIGANGNQGSAYVYTFIGSWVPQQKLAASDGGASDYFGTAVALDGATVVVGADNDTIGQSFGQGSAYVFVSPPCPALTLAPATLPRGALGAAYNQPITAAGGGAGNYRFAVSSGTLPPGLTLGYDNGQLSGTPTAMGTYRFTITATFLLSGCSGRREYTLTITPPCPQITIQPEMLPDGTAGAAYHKTLTATGGAAPYNFAPTAGDLPAGLSISSAGVLGGTPTQSGNFEFTLRATDANGCATLRVYTLTIKTAAVACVSAASYKAGAAPESIVAAFGLQMAQQTQAASGLPLPTELAGVRARVRDSQGVERLVQFFFVSPGQINLLIPAGTAGGPATINLDNGATGQFEITSTAPGIFAANADGRGVPAAVSLRVRADGSSLYEPVAKLEGNRFVPAPLDLGPAGEQVFLVLYGTGIRFRQTVSASIGGVEAKVLFAGAVAGFAGLDQINLSLPRSLIGRGEMEVQLLVDGVAANTVRISVR
jgi:uncharacterized protein (TIGR03437 family)